MFKGLSPIGRRLAVIPLLLLVVGLTTIPPDPPPPRPTERVVWFDRLVGESGRICKVQPAPACVAVAWSHADRDRDDALSLREVRELRVAVQEWAIWRRSDLLPVWRSGIAVGLIMLDGLGVDAVHAAYDLDGDGRLSRAELLTDVRLDQRLIAEVLVDPDAIDRRAIAGRLGLPVQLLDRLQPR